MPTALVAPLEVVVRHSLSPPSKLDEPEASSNSASTSEYGLSRRDTEQILDYYQSEDAGRTYIGSKGSHFSESYPELEPPTGAQSATRPSSVGRHSSGDPTRTSMESVASSSGGVQRRTSQRSAGGADKRRLAIVELDSQPESQMSSGRDQGFDTSGSFSQPSLDFSLLARRGVDSSRLGGLALVAPPDARPSSFTGSDLSLIPVSAPATGVPPPYQETKTESFQAGHHRSMSEAQSRKKGVTKASPRDIGIVGTLGSLHSASPEQTENPRPECQRPSTSEGDRGSGGGAPSDALTAPVFQTPRSRSPSPLPLTGGPPSTNIPTSESPVAARAWPVGHEQQLTPSIGQDKELGRPVAAPVVMDLSAGQPIIGRSPNIIRSVSPNAEPTTSSSHTYVDRETHRTSGRLPFKPNQAALSYLHYQPGVHSTAGPLPSPPRHLTHQHPSPPPRPPRALSPPLTRRNEMGHAKSSSRTALPDGSKSMPITSMKAPAPASHADSDLSTSAISASSSGSDDRAYGMASSALDENEKSTGHHDQIDKTPTRSGPSHVREGAFPISSVFLSSPSQSPPSPSQHQNLDTLVASIGGLPEDDGTSSQPQAQSDLKREGSWVSLSAESFGGEPESTSPPSSYPSSAEESAQVATTAVGSDDGLVDQRRASLPAPPPPEPPKRAASLLRRPSLLGIARTSRSQASSPSSLPSIPRKAPSSWPDAMNFLDVLAKKTAAERALAYAAKVRELSTEETGLTEWLYLNSRKGMSSSGFPYPSGESPPSDRREASPATVPSTAPTSRAFAKQPRHLSRNSMASEVTFPIRQDSYTATDLSPRPPAELSSPTSLSPTLPYPSLAHGVGIRRRSSRTLTVDSSVASLSGSSRSIGGGFFASIGRKASVKKDRPLAPASPTKLMSSRQTPQPRPVKLGTAPTLPGGPRAPARYAQRAHSVVFNTPEPPRPESQPLSMSPRQTVESTEAFGRQLGKLADLLPQADKDVLAGYLRRAPNQDPMTAIGSYLEDEKQGCLRHD
ncbi:hypothetical protein JB92DRAFT_3128359 [Gautieria morchelliformis]|nr:hypothetical protein JB92DRAFT_3128359 [Gautieria morchelliformis]